MFAPYDVAWVVAHAGMPTALEQTRCLALDSAGLAVKVMAIPPSQTSADLRSLRYVLSESPPVIQVRACHGTLFLDPLLFRGAFAPFHAVWTQLGVPELAETTVECVKHEARVYVATTWLQLPALAVAAAYHNAAVLFMPAVGELAACPIRAGQGDPLTVLFEQVLKHTVAQVLAPHASQRAAYQRFFRAGVGVMPAEWQQCVPQIAALVEAHPRQAAWPELDVANDVRARIRSVSDTLARAQETGDPEADPRDVRSRLPAPLLTLAIPTYNRSALLLHTLSSLCAQAERYGVETLCEIVISDNASPDDTGAIAALMSRNTRIAVRYHRNDGNRGVGYNVVQALRLARGTFCLLLGDDDFVVECALPRLLQALLQAELQADSAAMVIFRGTQGAFPYEEMAAIDTEAVAREFFYHIGNFGLAAVRTQPALAALARHERQRLADADLPELQRFWPQTQLYFLAMQGIGESQSKHGDTSAHPNLDVSAADTMHGPGAAALVVPAVMVSSPLHLALTRYTARYLWDEGFFSLYEVARLLAPEMPAWFLPTVHAHYVAERLPAISEQIVNTFSARDSASDKRAACRDMLHALALLNSPTHTAHDTAHDTAVLMHAISAILLRYAAPTTLAELQRLLLAMSMAAGTPRADAGDEAASESPAMNTDASSTARHN